MPIQLSQADLDAKRVLVKDAVVAYHQALRTYKDEMGSLPAHLDRNDNPHGLTKAQIGLGNVPNAAPATVQQSLDGFLSNKLSVPAGTAAQVEDRLSALKQVGYEITPTSDVASVITEGYHRLHMTTDKSLSVSLSAGQRAAVVLSQGATVRSVTWSSGIRWSVTVDNTIWDYGEEDVWPEERVGHLHAHYVARALTDAYNNGEHDTLTEQYKEARWVVAGDYSVVYVKVRRATIETPASNTPHGRWVFEFWNTGGYTYGKSTYLGAVTNTTPTSQTPHSTDDRIVTTEAATPYVGTLNPDGPAEYTNAQFTRDVFDALGWADSSKVDPSLVTWEIFNSPDGRVIYVPSRPLFGAVSYNALLARKLLHGDTTVTLPTRGDWQSGNWYLPTAHATFRVVTPEVIYSSYYASAYRTTTDGNTPALSIVRLSARARALRSLLSPAERALYPLASGDVSVANYTAADLGIANSEKEWGRTIASNGRRAIAVSGLFDVSWHELNELAGWRPFLIADYETTLS